VGGETYGGALHELEEFCLNSFHRLQRAATPDSTSMASIEDRSSGVGRRLRRSRCRAKWPVTARSLNRAYNAFRTPGWLLLLFGRPKGTARWPQQEQTG
jgi:hypothetical protein